AAGGSVVVAPSADDRIDALTELVKPLRTEVVLVRIVAREQELAVAASAVGAHRSIGRTAAFTSDDASADLVKLATGNDAYLVLVDAPPGLDAPQLPLPLARLLERSPAHVAMLSGARLDLAHPVFVPFGGGEHDWAA